MNKLKEFRIYTEELELYAENDDLTQITYEVKGDQNILKLILAHKFENLAIYDIDKIQLYITENRGLFEIYIDISDKVDLIPITIDADISSLIDVKNIKKIFIDFLLG